MKMILIINYWLMMASWCMFLNGYLVVALLLGLAGIILLMFGKKRINYFRLAILTIFIHSLALVFTYSYNIPYFFPKLELFISFMSLNGALSYEHLINAKKSTILPILFVMLLITISLLVLIAFVPADLYSIFGKNRLFMMESLIFLPYLIPVIISLLVKERVYRQIKQTV